MTERRTTVRADTSYTALYFYGTNTYFEFFDAGGQSAAQFGGSGVAFGVDVAGGLQALAQELPDEIFAAPQPVTRQYEGRQVPWFYRAVPKNFPLASGVTVWLMEYHPRFLDEWNPRPADKTVGVSRQRILRRYAAVLKDVPARPLLEDVVSLTVAADEPTRKRLTGLGGSFGYREQRDGDATALKGLGDEFTTDCRDGRGAGRAGVYDARQRETERAVRVSLRAEIRFEVSRRRAGDVVFLTARVSARRRADVHTRERESCLRISGRRLTNTSTSCSSRPTTRSTRPCVLRTRRGCRRSAWRRIRASSSTSSRWRTGRAASSRSARSAATARSGWRGRCPRTAG